MFSYIDKLRKKPLKERREAARTITIISVIIIGTVWILFKVFFLTGNETANEERGEQDTHTKNSERQIVGPYE